MDENSLVSSSINELIRFGFLEKIAKKKLGTGTIYEVFDQRLALAEIIMKRLSSSREPQSF